MQRPAPLAPGVFGVAAQPALDRGVGGRCHADLFQHPCGVLLAGRLDDPGQDQLAEHLITACRLVEAEQVVGTGESVPEVRHLRGGDLQRPSTSGGRKTRVELSLILSQSLGSSSLQRLELVLVVGRAEVLDIA